MPLSLTLSRFKVRLDAEETRHRPIKNNKSGPRHLRTCSNEKQSKKQSARNKQHHFADYCDYCLINFNRLDATADENNWTEKNKPTSQILIFLLVLFRLSIEKQLRREKRIGSAARGCHCLSSTLYKKVRKAKNRGVHKNASRLHGNFIYRSTLKICWLVLRRQRGIGRAEEKDKNARGSVIFGTEICGI